MGGVIFMLNFVARPFKVNKKDLFFGLSSLVTRLTQTVRVEKWRMRGSNLDPPIISLIVAN
jgi:hypothetical protein